MIVCFLLFIAEEAPRNNLKSSPFQSLLSQACSSAYRPCETLYLGWSAGLPDLFPRSKNAPRVCCQVSLVHSSNRKFPIPIMFPSDCIRISVESREIFQPLQKVGHSIHLPVIQEPLKVIFHPCGDHISAIDAPGLSQKEYKSAKSCMREFCPIHLSFQKRILVPSPTL